MPRPHKIADRLDGELDGRRRGAAAAELAPLLLAADALRAHCASLQLDPGVAEPHLAAVLAPRTAAPSPARRRPPAARRRWPRRVAALALAAALTAAPLLVLSTGTLPGEALYPVKLTAEGARLTAARLSPDGMARERARIADTRLRELDELVSDGQVEQIPGAISALDGAVAAAQRAAGAVTGGRGAARAAALDQRLRELRAGRAAQLTSLLRRLPSSTPVAARVRIEGAVQRSLGG